MKVIEHRKVDHTGNCEITFIRIDPENIKNTLAEIIKTLLDLSWLSRFDGDYRENSFKKKAEKTIADIQEKFSNCDDSKVTSQAGEYVVSELARESLVNQMSYLHIPLAELLGMKISGNPGFDFHSQNNTTSTVIFGEAKFNSHQSAYGDAIKQIADFVKDEKDIMQLTDLEHFCTPEALNRANQGFKGFAVAFSAKSTKSDDLIANIIAHTRFCVLSKHIEIVIVAVNL